MAMISLSGGSRFEAQPGETVLDAALRAGVVLEHSCRTGRCGACKGQLQEGQATALKDETGLSAPEQAQGWMLTCARSPTTDVRIDIQDLGGLQLHPAKTLPCRIDSLQALAPDVMQVRLRLPPNQALRYHAGQYIDVIGFDGLRRSYSLASTPQSGPPLELHIKRVPGGAMSDFWFERAKANDLLRLHGPLGTFFLRDVAGLDLVLLATGTGLAPVKAMLESITGMPDAQRPASVHLYWGGRQPQDLYWDAQGFDLGKGQQRLNFTPVLSRADEAWRGARGHVQQAALAAGHDWQRTAVYACGSQGMIDSARSALTAAGLPLRRFHADAFVSSS